MEPEQAKDIFTGCLKTLQTALRGAMTEAQLTEDLTDLNVKADLTAAIVEAVSQWCAPAYACSRAHIYIYICGALGMDRWDCGLDKDKSGRNVRNTCP